MPERLDAVGVASPPIREQAQRARQLASGLGELVREPRRPPRVGMGHDERLVLQVLQALAQHVRRDPRERLLEVAEPPRAVEQRLNQEEGPAVADTLQCGLERGCRGLPSRLAHVASVPAIAAVYSHLQITSNSTEGRLRWLFLKS